MLPIRLLPFKSKDREEYKKYSKNFISSHLSIKNSMHLELVVVPFGLPSFFLCGEMKDVTTILLYS